MTPHNPGGRGSSGVVIIESWQTPRLCALARLSTEHTDKSVDNFLDGEVVISTITGHNKSMNNNHMTPKETIKHLRELVSLLLEDRNALADAEFQEDYDIAFPEAYKLRVDELRTLLNI